MIDPWGLAGGWYFEGCPQWLVVSGNGEEPGEGMRQKMSGAAAVAVVLLRWQIMIQMID